jgi:predicted small metal-binding protein
MVQETVKMISYACKDVGVDCPWSASAETKEELEALITEHAKIAHDLDPISPELWEAVRGAYKHS